MREDQKASSLRRKKRKRSRALAPGKMSETEAQERLVAYLREVLPLYGRRVYAVPNERKHEGSKRARVAQWRALERRGASRGVPDLHIDGAPPGMPHCGGVKIEMKRDEAAGYRPGQIGWLLHYCSIGWLAARCDGYEAGLALVRAAGYVREHEIAAQWWARERRAPPFYACAPPPLLRGGDPFTSARLHEGANTPPPAPFRVLREGLELGRFRARAENLVISSKNLDSYPIFPGSSL